MRILFTISLGLMLTGCATGVKVTPVNIQPVQHIKSDPFDVTATIGKADQALSDENYKAALEDYLRVIAFDPSRSDGHLGAGRSYLALGMYERAARIYWHNNLVSQTELQADEISIGKILSGIYTGRYENVESAINDGMLIDPDDARLWNAKGRWHDGRGEWMEALSCYVAAMKAGERHSATINNMGMSLLMQGRQAEAEEKFQQALLLSPDTEIYDNNLRMLYILRGEILRALEGISDRRAANILNDAGYVSYKNENYRLAEKLFSKALEVSPVFHVEAQANLDQLRDVTSTQ